MKKNIVLGSAIALALGSTGASAVIFSFDNSITTAVQGTDFSYTKCTGISMSAGREFRMCDTTGTALGGGLPAQKDTINGIEQWRFDSGLGLMTAVVGFASTNATSGLSSAVAYYVDLGYVSPSSDRNGGVGLDQGTDFFGASFGFLASYVGSESNTAGASHPNDVAIAAPVYTLASNRTDFTVYFATMEAQWNGTHFSLGRDGGTGVDAGSTGVTFTGTHTRTTHGIDFSMWAEHTIQGGEDNGAAGFSGWTAQWLYQGTMLILPVPAAAWLFGSGLLGLIGVARRKKSSA